MIHAYSEMYLNTVMKNLAGMVDLAVNEMRLAPDEFARKFCISRAAGGIEHADPNMLSGKSANELLEIVLGEEISSNIIPTDRSREYWAGWILARAQWELNVPFCTILSAIPISSIIAMYNPYHEADEGKTVESIRIRMPKPVSRLKALRKKCRLTQEQLADLSGVNIRSIRSYEQCDDELGKAQGETLLCLAKVLGCTVEDMLVNRSFESGA